MDDLQPVPVAQVVAARNGRKILIEEDVGSVVAQIREIDPNFRVRFNELGEFFVIYHDEGNGRERLITTAQELDHRLLRRVKEIADPSYDFAAELDRHEAEKAARHRQEVREHIGEVGERLFHAARSDKGRSQSTIIVPREV